MWIWRFKFKLDFVFIYVLTTVADPENDGDIVIKDTSDTATNIEIRQRVNSTTVLTQTIEAAS